MNLASQHFRSEIVYPLLMSALFATACYSSSATRQVQESAESKLKQTTVAVSQLPDVQILVDEAILRKPYAILGGTLKNVSTEKLENLSIELDRAYARAILTDGDFSC